MKFFCPSCCREEEVIGDRKPLCRFCRLVMIPPSDYSEWWVSPNFAMDRMRKIAETYGISRAQKDGRFKKEREAWTTAMLALALTKLTGHEWWIEIETVENTPDTKLQRIDQSLSGNVIQTYEVEVVDWERHVDDIMDVIQKKCACAYPNKYLLLVNARNDGKALDFDRVIDEMKTLRPRFLEVWIVASIGPITRPVMKVGRVSPAHPFVDLERADFENAGRQKSFLKRGTRGTSCGFKDLGLVYMPIPRGD